MLLIIGYIVVTVAVLGGFMMAGGHPVLLLHVSEFVVIGGVCVGLVIVSSTKDILIAVVKDIKFCLGANKYSKDQFITLMKLLYELLMLARRNGVIALDDHVSKPEDSEIFKKYPEILSDKETVEFMCNAFTPIVDGKTKPEALCSMLEDEIDNIEEEAGHSVGVLNLVGDSLPGVGIVAAVLGIINTMTAISQGPEMVGKKVAAALTGTFLGVLGAYGFVNPLAKKIQLNHRLHSLYLRVISKSIGEFAKGTAPLMAIEITRRSLDKSLQPPADELEELLKSAVKKV